MTWCSSVRPPQQKSGGERSFSFRYEPNFRIAASEVLESSVATDGFEVRVFSNPFKVFESLCHRLPVCVIAQAGLSNNDLSRSRLRKEGKRP